jgi:hypothetical protein
MSDTFRPDYVSADGYLHCNANAGHWWAMERNRYGFEFAPAPVIPWPPWSIAIVGALVFAGVVNWVCRK